MDIGRTTPNGNIVLISHFSYSAHELASRIDLQQLRPFQGPTSVDLSKPPARLHQTL